MCTTTLKQRLQTAITKRWYSSPDWLYLLFPLELFFRWITFRRRHNKILLKRGDRPTIIVVGNITVGGTGKSPLIAALAKSIQQEQKPEVEGRGSVAVISRGYCLESKSVVSDPRVITALSSPAQVGDEPVMLSQQTKAPVIVCQKRRLAAEKAKSDFNPAVILSDDGMQHYDLPRSFEIAVVDSSRGFGNGYCLPVGPLREPLNRLNDVDGIVVNATDVNAEQFAEKLKKAFSVPVFIMRLVPKKMVNLHTEEERELSAWQTYSDFTSSTTEMVAFAGIGHPPRFFNTLASIGLSVRGVPFPDHHQFSVEDLSSLGNGPVFMTEKDAVKCRYLVDELPHKNYWFIPVEAELEQSFWPWFDTLRNNRG